jgi:CheY-like chemotaxis protein
MQTLIKKKETMNLNEEFKNQLVMLIDDSDIDNFVNEKQMQHYGFAKKVLVYSSSVQALLFLKKADKEKSCISELPSYLFLDLNMPILDGYSFLEEFNKLSDHIKDHCRIVILTSSVNPSDMIKAGGNSAVQGYLSKPLIKSNLEQLESVPSPVLYKTAS